MKYSTLLRMINNYDIENIKFNSEAINMLKYAVGKQVDTPAIPLTHCYPDGQYVCMCGCPILECYTYCPNCGQRTYTLHPKRR